MDRDQVLAELARLQKMIEDTNRNLDPNDILNSAQVAKLLGVSKRYFLEQIAKRPGFPPPSSRTGRPRWIRGHIQQWVRDGVPKKAGRPRKQLSQ